MRMLSKGISNRRERQHILAMACLVTGLAGVPGVVVFAAQSRFEDHPAPKQPGASELGKDGINLWDGAGEPKLSLDGITRDIRSI
jgi:hypothetical protein